MTIEVTYEYGNENHSSQCYTYTGNKIIFTFVFPRQKEEPQEIESTAQVLPLSQEATR